MPKRIAKTPCLGGIYRITCVESGKSYIGSTKHSFKVRWNQHIYRLNKQFHYNQHLQNAWVKRGEDSFEFCVLEPVRFVEDLIYREQVWIDIYQAFDHTYGFNIAPRADRCCMSMETKEKIRVANTGKKRTAEQIAKFTGRKPTPETRARISAAKIGGKHTDEAKAKVSVANTGRKRTPEVIAKRVATRSKKNPFYYKVIAPDGTAYEPIDNLRAFCRERGLCESGLSHVANGSQRHCMGWTCQKLLKSDGSVAGKAFDPKNPFYYEVSAPDGTIYKAIQNLAKFCKKMGLSRAGMAAKASRDGKSRNGWTCRRILKHPSEKP